LWTAYIEARNAMTSKKQWTMFLSVAVASSVARAQPPANDIPLSLDQPTISIVESVIEGSVVVEAKPELQSQTELVRKTPQPARIERSVLETPRIEAVPVAPPTANGVARTKALLIGHGTEIGGSDSKAEESVSEAPTDAAAEMIRQRFANGKPQVERWVVEDSKGNIVNHGKYVEYDSQGAVVSSGSYVYGKREGKWTKQINAEQTKNLVGAHDKGFVAPFTSLATFKDGQLDGEWSVVDAQARVVSVWSYTAGVRNGPSWLYNVGGEVTQSITYKDNLADGPARMATEGEAAKDTVFTDGLMLRQVDKWFPAVAGKPRVLQSQESQLVLMPLNVVSSDWANSSVTFQSSATEPIRHGLAVTFYANGQRESQGSYDRGRRSGTFAWWYANGQQKTVGEYIDDAENSEWTWWHENGMKQASGMYADGRKVEEWSLWSPEGKLVQRTVPRDAAQVAGRNTAGETQNR
jgi:antitoxin component YwqK of YwqJK toxin-antitoxin module